MGWNRHDNNIYDKITSWFDVIGPELSRRDILAENVYNMDETGVMLSKLGSVRVLVGKDDRRDYRGAELWGVQDCSLDERQCMWLPTSRTGSVDGNFK